MLGIIGAMDQEVSILKEKMEVKKIDNGSLTVEY